MFKNKSFGSGQSACPTSPICATETTAVLMVKVVNGNTVLKMKNLDLISSEAGVNPPFLCSKRNHTFFTD